MSHVGTVLQGLDQGDPLVRLVTGGGLAPIGRNCVEGQIWVRPSQGVALLRPSGGFCPEPG